MSSTLKEKTTQKNHKIVNQTKCDIRSKLGDNSHNKTQKNVMITDYLRNDLKSRTQNLTNPYNLMPISLKK